MIYLRSQALERKVLDDNKPHKTDIPFILHITMHIKDALYPCTIMVGRFKSESEGIYSRLTIWVEHIKYKASKEFLEKMGAEFTSIESESMFEIHGVAHFNVISARA